jgi:outer membrane receptor for ferrienterochelin and colicin
VRKEIGLKYLTASLFAEAYYFHADYEGFIERVTVGLQPNGLPIQQRRNLHDAAIQGVEANLTTFSLKGELGWRKIAVSVYDGVRFQ